MRKTPWIGVLLLGASIFAQESANYRISDHNFNSGGAGTVLTSASYRINLDLVGGAAVRLTLSSPSFRMGGSFLACYPPPGEVHGLWFSDVNALEWQRDASAGSYNLYRDLISSLSGLEYGECEQYDLPLETATDEDPVPAGDGFFYLVTVENLLGEEGTKGVYADGSERPNPNQCP